jgi:phage terminase large subunit-like protein
MASGAGLYMLDADGESEPEVYVAAAARNQAGIVLGQARSMVQRSPLLLDRLVPHRYVIECPRNGGIMRSLSSDAALQHGLNPSANIVDELHAHKSAELYTALTTGTGAREQPFTLWITTAGVAGEGILAELFESMFSGTGELEDRDSLLIYRDRVNGTLIYWYGAPRDADIEDPAVWYAANPVSWLHDGKYLGAQFARLRARGALLEWRRYHLNQFVGFEDAWLRDGAWRDTTGDLPLNAALPIGVGIDKNTDRNLRDPSSTCAVALCCPSKTLTSLPSASDETQARDT